MNDIEPRSPASRRPRLAAPSRKGQAGLTLIEFMVSVVIGMLMIAALATLIGNQSGTRAEIDKSGKMIENGRYATQTMASDVQMAGYWGELTAQPAVPAALPNPCSKALVDLEAAMGVPVQGYDSPATLPTDVSACVSNHKPGTDVLVVRRLDPDMSAMETAGVTDLTKIVEGQIYLQTGMDALGASLIHAIGTGSSSATTNATTFTLKKKDKVTAANLRKMVVHIYYISKCSVPVSSSCTSGDNGNPIPTLKRVELDVSGGAPEWKTVTLAEGIENLQIDYGVDTDGDGAANGTDVDGSALATAEDWANVMTLKVHLLARSTETSGGFTDTKSYGMGVGGNVTPATAEQGYKRHAFVQSVRLVNPAGRRVL